MKIDTLHGPPQIPKDPVLTRATAWLPLPSTTPVPIEAHKDTQCRWPVGDPGTPGFGFCGCWALHGKPYCESHEGLRWAQPAT